MISKTLLATMIVLVVVSACTKNVNFDDNITIYKTASCGCCGVYSQYVEAQGANVNVREVSTLQPMFEEYNIPVQLQSCHISKVGDYVIVGHVPIEAIDKLLAEKPDIKGLSLPEMPSGTPGMPGPKKGDWIIYSLNNDGTNSEYMRI